MLIYLYIEKTPFSCCLHETTSSSWLRVLNGLKELIPFLCFLYSLTNKRTPAYYLAGESKNLKLTDMRGITGIFELILNKLQLKRMTALGSLRNILLGFQTGKDL